MRAHTEDYCSNSGRSGEFSGFVICENFGNDQLK